MRKIFLHPQSNICLFDFFYFINSFLSNQVFYNEWAIKLLKGMMLQHEYSDASHWRVFLQVSSPFSSIIAIFNRANKIWVETLLLSGKVRIIFWVFSQSQLYLEFLLPDTWWEWQSHFWTMLFSMIVQSLPQNPSICENKIAAATNITTLLCCLCSNVRHGTCFLCLQRLMQQHPGETSHWRFTHVAGVSAD